MKTMGELFLFGANNLENIHKTPIKWGLNIVETK
jgi:hypothetical protein